MTKSTRSTRSLSRKRAPPDAGGGAEDAADGTNADKEAAATLLSYKRRGAPPPPPPANSSSSESSSEEDEEEDSHEEEEQAGETAGPPARDAEIDHDDDDDDDTNDEDLGPMADWKAKLQIEKKLHELAKRELHSKKMQIKEWDATKKNEEQAIKRLHKVELDASKASLNGALNTIAGLRADHVKLNRQVSKLEGENAALKGRNEQLVLQLSKRDSEIADLKNAMEHLKEMHRLKLQQADGDKKFQIAELQLARTTKETASQVAIHRQKGQLTMSKLSMQEQANREKAKKKEERAANLGGMLQDLRGGLMPHQGAAPSQGHFLPPAAAPVAPQAYLPGGGFPSGVYPIGGCPNGRFPNAPFPNVAFPNTAFPNGGFPSGAYQQQYASYAVSHPHQQVPPVHHPMAPPPAPPQDHNLYMQLCAQQQAQQQAKQQAQQQAAMYPSSHHEQGLPAWGSGGSVAAPHHYGGHAGQQDYAQMSSHQHQPVDDERGQYDGAFSDASGETKYGDENLDVVDDNTVHGHTDENASHYY